jgi:hypothetical protein
VVCASSTKMNGGSSGWRHGRSRSWDICRSVGGRIGGRISWCHSGRISGYICGTFCRITMVP